MNTNNLTLNDLTGLTKTYADSRDELYQAVRDLNDQIEKIKRHALPRLRRLKDATANHTIVLASAIDQNRHLFASPRSLVLYSTKIGLQKHPGGLTWTDPAEVCAKIHKIYGADASTLLHITELPNKQALNKLAVGELRKIAVEVTKDTDLVVIKTTDSELDKLIDKMLASAIENEPATTPA